ncbi:trehalose-phosphatase [Galactobacter caseinivorans]|uniref:Trehalose 6-phosphate phosphatase n=1 Tax=Galactobacter caseinivorans TaxID=2676123 RepID=A0A496PGE5_9MICC|nr:trehalose-phosphatase [Galactobacter caseinivorans]RKW69424.1 trehalose-phosphatase [Galactobacter caseinivorans]
MTGLSPALRERVGRLARAGHLLIALDFDGTLSPFVDDPSQARPLPAAARALRELADAADTDIALISGRALESLRDVASPGPRTLLVGSHGAEHFAPSEFEAEVSQAQLSNKQSKLLKKAAATLEAVAQQFEGAWVESKPAGLVLHVRMTPQEQLGAVVRAAFSGLDRLDGVTATQGKGMIEVTVLEANKGQGLNWLREVTDASVVLFAGDDVTDEDAFKVLSPADVGIKVGTGRTAAEFSVDGPGDIAELLQLLVDVRG